MFRVKSIVFSSHWCYDFGPLKLIVQFSRDDISSKTRVKFLSSHWSVPVRPRSHGSGGPGADEAPHPGGVLKLSRQSLFS